jgi:HEPN domain-containing protein
MRSYKDWILKAEHDLKIAKDEIMEKEPVTDMVCFHFQQAVEKLLKAFLLFHKREINKTHDIAFLINECRKIDSEFNELFDKGIDSMTIYAIDTRYPGDIYMPSIEETKDVFEKAKYVREFVMKKVEK